MSLNRPAPVAKGKADKPEPISPSTVAFREYERVSYYLATQGDFDFTMDAEARELFFSNKHSQIDHLCSLRRETFGEKIPKGFHIDGLALRTQEYERRNALAVKKGKRGVSLA